LLGEFVVVVVVVIEEIMQFGHEQLDVYRVSLEYAVRESWAPYGDYDNDHDNEHRFAEYARDRRTSIGGCQSNIHPLKTLKSPFAMGGVDISPQFRPKTAHRLPIANAPLFQNGRWTKP